MSYDLMFYIASPYSHKFNTVRKRREEEVTRFAGILHERGLVTYPPITTSAAVCRVMGWNKSSFAHWKNDDLTFVKKSNGVIVLMLDGWKESIGVQEEIKYAESLQLPIYYVEYPYDSIDITELLNEISFDYGSLDPEID